MTGISLEGFYQSTDPVTLNNCDLEEVHRSGAVQEHAVLLAFCVKTGTLKYWSTNAPRYGLAISDAALEDAVATEGLTYEVLLGDAAEEIEELVSDPANQYQHLALDSAVSLNDGERDIIICPQPDHVFVEILPSAELSPRDLKNKLRLMNRATARMIAAKDFDEAADVAVAAIRELIGFDRVKIYEFLPDGSGNVRNEARCDEVAAYLGLHFPRTDIPQQARYLYQILPYRNTFGVSDAISQIRGENGPITDTLDLTWSLGRSVSTMHTAYLRNMGIGSAFVAALRDGDMLWGLISCHNRLPKPIAFDLWGLVRDVANALMVKFRQLRAEEIAVNIAKMRDIEANVAERMRDRGRVEEVLADYAETLREFLKADGFAFQFDGQVYTTGTTPPPDFIKQLIQYIATMDSDVDHFRSKALHREWTPAKDHLSTACGVLVQPVVLHRVCQLVWFRRPITQKIRWAGNPDDKQIEWREDGTHTLNPRQSFETWVSEHDDEARDWTDAEIGTARELFKEVLDIIASQAQTLTRMNRELQLTQEETREELSQFAYAAAHDIQNPINTIASALEIIQSAKGDVSDPMVEKSLAFAMKSSARLRGLANQMADFVALGQRAIDFQKVPLNEVMDDALQMLDTLILESKAAIDIPDLPEVAGNKDLLTILFLNLFSNAIKYRAPDRAPHVTVDFAQRDKLVHVGVSDNGMGIDPKHVAKIFQPFQRLHRHDEIAGSGLGLATCQRIAELHKTFLDLDTDYQDGARFTMSFSTEVKAQNDTT